MDLELKKPVSQDSWNCCGTERNPTSLAHLGFEPSHSCASARLLTAALPERIVIVLLFQLNRGRIQRHDPPKLQIFRFLRICARAGKFNFHLLAFQKFYTTSNFTVSLGHDRFEKWKSFYEVVIPSERIHNHQRLGFPIFQVQLWYKWKFVPQ